MPGYDQTGPNAQGAMTGGGFGKCNPNADAAPTPNFHRGRRFLRRGYRGNGRGRKFFTDRRFIEDNVYTKEEQLSFLKQEASRIETALSQLHTQITTLENNEDSK